MKATSDFGEVSYDVHLFRFGLVWLSNAPAVIATVRRPKMFEGSVMGSFVPFFVAIPVVTNQQREYGSQQGENQGLNQSHQ